MRTSWRGGRAIASMMIDPHFLSMAKDARALLTPANAKAAPFAFVFIQSELSRRAKLRRKLEKLLDPPQ
jgi:hypothetical protein